MMISHKFIMSSSDEGFESDLLWEVTDGYLPIHDTEIELIKGDLVTNLKDLSNGWSIGRNITRDTVGIFPSAYVIPHPEFISEPPDVTKPTQAAIIVNTDAVDSASPNKLLKLHSDRNIIENLHTYEQLSKLKNINENPQTRNNFILTELDNYNCNTLPISCSPKKVKSSKKPHVFVKPNSGKNTFMSQETIPKAPTNDMEARQSPIRRFSYSNDPRRSPSHSFSDSTSSPLPQRNLQERARAGSNTMPQSPARSILQPEPNGVINYMDHHFGGTIGNTQINSSQPLMTLENGRNFHQISPGSPNLDRVQRQNVANETIIRNSPLTPKKHKVFDPSNNFYQDYRTLECPAYMDGSMQLRFKPILKSKHLYSRGRGNEIHYHEQQDQQKSLRLMLSLLTALLIGLLLFLWLHYGLTYDLMITVIMATSAAFMLTLMLMLSRLCRCTIAVMVPSLCTTRGRVSYLILITGFLLDGPITNIYLNMGEVSRSMSCSAEQSYNQSMLLLQPFDTMMSQLNHTVMTLHLAATDVKNGLHPLHQGLSNVELGLYKGQESLLGTQEACLMLVDRAFIECSNGIYAAQNQCLSVVNALGDVYHTASKVIEHLNPELWAPKHSISLQKRQTDTSLSNIPENKKDVCEPLDNLLVCQSLNDSDTLCAPSGWAGSAIHDAINATMAAMRKLKKTIHFTVTPEPFYNVRRNASQQLYEVRKHVAEEFQHHTSQFHFVISIINKIIPISIFILIYVAYVHIRNYISKDTYDNIYVTSQFKSLDMKRSEIAGESILPLKKYERNHLIDTTCSEISFPEYGLYRIGLTVFLLHVGLSFICYFFDYVLYWILAIARKHGEPSYDFTGRNSLEYVIEGEGVISNLLHVFLKGFHPANLFGYTLDSHHCLPKPHPPSIIVLFILFLFYFVLLLTILFKAYMIRFRNRVTAYFYPDREKARIVHLYNVVLNHRSRMPKLLHHRAKANCRELQLQQQISICHQMLARMPPCRLLPLKSDICLICSCDDNRSFRECQTENCLGIFCAECYDDLGHICPLCHQISDFSDEEEYEDLEDDLQPYYRSSKIYV